MGILRDELLLERKTMTPRENYMIAARGGKPERVPLFPFDANVFMPDFWAWRDPETGADFCNIRWVTNDAGEMPEPGWQAMDDITKWREIVKFPKVSEMDWEGMLAKYNENRDPDKVDIAMINTNGIFLIPINMMGWTDGLCALIEEPEETEAFISAITDFFVELIEYVGKYFHPDIVMSGDDFAAARGPFISQTVFREMYKPYIQKITKAVHDIGALEEFHCCGNCQYLTKELFDAGVDIMQLPEPNDELLADKMELGSKFVMNGGWDRHGPGCVPGASEEEVRESVRLAMDTYGKDGGLIFWDGGICGTSEDSRQKMAWLVDEAVKYGASLYK